MLLWQKLAEESAGWCCTSATMDVKTVRGRCEHEGVSFLTITLPSFGKDFERSLDLGYVDRSLFTGFRWKGGLPRFLGGFLDRVFDRNSGVLLDSPDIDAILAVRQLSLMFSKILLPCSDARTEDAIKGYIECEKEVKRGDFDRDDRDVADFQRISSLLYSSVFSEVDHSIYHLELLPKHGPGATADRLRGNAKYDQQAWTERLENILPAGEMLIPNWRYYQEFKGIRFLEPEAEIPVRVVTVPKTLKTPRIIAIEPTAMQYSQQAIDRELRHAISRNDTLRRMIGLDDQVPNQVLAKVGSQSGTEATLDLSEASDRVSNQLVRDMLHNWPYLHEAVDATRSRKADVPGHGVIRLAKFASMGSALTFPVEALVFTTLIFIGIERELNTPLSWREIKHFSNKVRVYGDDIIIPVEFVRSVVSVLETFGSKVNRGKSFWTGKFRESCGKEYYAGQDVSIVKVRRTFPTRQRHAQEKWPEKVVSIVALRNQLYFAGYWSTVGWLDDYIREVITFFPVVLPTSPVQGRYSVLGYETQKMHDTLHSPLVRGYVVKSDPPRDPLEGIGALLKFMLKRGGLPSVDSRHLERAGRPQSVDIKLRWKQPF